MIKNSRYGLVYLDINAQNMFFTPEDEIKVIDQDLYEISYECLRAPRYDRRDKSYA